VGKRTVASQIGDTHTVFEIRAKYLRGFETLLTVNKSSSFYI